MFKSYVLLSLICLFMMGCATGGKSQSTDSSAQVKDDLESFRVTEDENPISNKNEIETSSTINELEDIPVEINPKVEKWINYFKTRGRPHMERYLLRSTRYEALMKKVLRDNGLPEDLFYIALIESGFNSQAQSWASAVGYWQFIRGTGKMFKLNINKMVDERKDPVLSTKAAAEYFKYLYKRLGSWYLAMAAYNVGEGRVERAIKKYKTRNFWKLSEIPKALPAETDNYVPKYIAAKLIAKNPDKHGFEGIDYMPPIEFDHIQLENPVNLRLMAEKMNINYEDFKDLNPKFKGEVAPMDLDKTLGLRIPPGTYESAVLAAKESATSVEEFVADQEDYQRYRIRRGDTLSNVAKRYRTNVAYLRYINDFSRKKKLRVGMTIKVPDRTPLKIKRPDLVSKRYHVVKKGETLISISRKYKVSLDKLRKANRFKSKTKFKVGSRILIPEARM